MHFLIMGIVLVMLSGCGVGGFQGPDNTNSNAPSSPQSNRVGGFVSLGPVAGGQVAIYNLNSDGSKQLLKTASTDVLGRYSSSVATTGPSLYVATGGSYTDEATGQTMSIPTATPLRAAMDTVSPVMSIAITPLTELAVEQAGPLLMATNIASANQLVSSLFKFDIVATQPLAPTADAFAQTAVITQSQKDYTLALAGISQMAVEYYNGNGSLSGVLAVLNAMNNDITNYKTLSSATALQFTTALSHFLASSNNKTGVSDINATNLVNAGGQALTLKLVTTSQLPAGVSIYGVQLTLTLPAGVTIRVSDFSDNQADPLVVYSSGVAPADIITFDGKYTPAAGGQPAYLTLAVGSAASWPVGEFATVICDLPPGSSYTSADFASAVSQMEVVDLNGNVIPGVSVVVQ
ncbi:MAG: hypothetical protein P4L44_01840 [Oryzomonas sp.]|uniref:hypothetical protein n=1 Tax=Oryzomonas sp. TaxID=2855186 RepID=UPI0028490D75|nr:hypothetical protein [Oryzomonas sp.]MDR3578685.1 hypothetical protein [Oryzomonas sp.]